MSWDSFYNNYKNIKQKLVTLLTSDNINANTSMGLTTLINKVDDLSLNTNNNITRNVSITWSDNNNVKNDRPSSVKVNLIDNNIIVDSLILNNTNNWTGSFTNTSNSMSISIDDIPNKYTSSISTSEYNSSITLHRQLASLTIEIIFEIYYEGEQVYIDSGLVDDSSLVFKVDGTDPSCPLIVPYSSFNNNRYTISNLDIGTYGVQLYNPESLSDGLEINDESVTVFSLTLADNGIAVALLFCRCIIL